MLEFFSKHVDLLRKKATETREKRYHRKGLGYGKALAEAKIAADMSAILSAQLPLECLRPAALASLPTDKFTRRILRFQRTEIRHVGFRLDKDNRLLLRKRSL